MISLLVVVGLSFAICLALTPCARAWARRLGLVDQPDTHRKIHQEDTPVAGGLAILPAVTAAVCAALFFLDSPGAALREHGAMLLGLLLGGMLIFAVGVADDFGRLRGRHKLLGQFAAVGIVIACGGWVQTVQLFGFRIELGWLGIPFTTFLLLGAINSLNLIDGMDGLLGSVGVILSLALAALALLAGHLWAATVALALAGALLGFLRYNLPPATVFLGDSGSMLVGLILGALTINCSLKAPATIALAMPIALLILPIFDTTAAIVRRKLTGRSIYTTDRGHLHHCLLRRGLSTPWALALVSVCCIAASASVLASQAFNNEGIALITAGAIIVMLIATRLFGHAEMLLIKGRIVSLLWPVGGVSHMEVRLQGSAAWKDLWQALKLRAGELKLQNILLDVNAPALHEGYHARWDQACAEMDERPLWHVEIPITAQGVSIGRLLLQGRPDDHPVWLKIAIVMKIVEDFHRSGVPAVAEIPQPAFGTEVLTRAFAPGHAGSAPPAPASPAALETVKP